jgi:hypothetical protein
VHVIVGVNTCVPPVLSVAEEGLTATEARAGMIVMTTAALCLVTPFRVALTNSVTVPPLPPPVKTTEDPIVELRVPRPLVIDHV